MAIKKELPRQLSAFDSNQLTIHKGMTEAPIERDRPLSSLAGAGLSAKSPLFVKVPGKPSKVALVLQSNATSDVKELLLEDLLESEVKAKDREVQATDQALQDKLQAIESDRDFLKGTLDARNILEKYEKKFKDRNLARGQNWKMHLDRNLALTKRLQRMRQGHRLARQRCRYLQTPIRNRTHGHNQTWRRSISGDDPKESSGN
jgi:hypothetical protein